VTTPAELPRLDPNRPTAARIYDYLLGGSHHFAADRDAARDMMASFPPLPRVLAAGRAFVRRATRFLAAEQGISQFLDLGSGIPTVRNVHEIALEADPRARVAYVDIDPVAVAHSHSILRGTRQAGCVQGDLRDPDAVLAHPGVRSLIDTARPVAVILNAVLHFVPDDAEAAAIVARYLAAVAPGSWLVIAHHTDDSGRPDEARARQIYTRSVQTLTPRSHAQISAYFAGLTLVEPGVVPTPQWRPEPGDQASQATEVPRYYGYAGVGRTG
jgi:SAM-dependent methyltransferase